MKLSDTLYDSVIDLWKKAAEKPFLIQMAEGELEKERFRYYMVQDYLYLLDYIEILKNLRMAAEDASLKEFLSSVIKETEHETVRVHIPHMKEIGVDPETLPAFKKNPVIEEYLDYISSVLCRDGVRAGMTALLQCSWVYAFIVDRILSRYQNKTVSSPYRFWFEAYSCPEYIEANNRWIEKVDHLSAGIGQEEAEALAGIFRRCAVYENRFWDALMQEPLV
ncbi:MAG: hypothetical protein IKE59_08745 [Erysipelotrichaceae bacterium]|nr:hypothetical protein [Erysipelotrichaceae bacterium]